jgi:hypothetical protein
MASILEAGFLSPDVDSFIRDHRDRNASWFSLAERLNQRGQAILASVQMKITEKGAADPQLIGLLLTVRTLSNYQAIVLLAERGMIVEARTLARCCYENVYCMAALQHGRDDFVKQMVDDDSVSRRKMSNWLLQKSSRLEHAGDGASDQLVQNITNIDARSPNAVRLVLEQAAEKAGVGDLYLPYRQLSWDSAHPTVQALSRYFSADQDDGKYELWWGPQTKDGEVADTISICMPAVFGVLTIAREMLMEETAPTLDALWNEYKELTITRELARR